MKHDQTSKKKFQGTNVQLHALGKPRAEIMK